MKAAIVTEFGRSPEYADVEDPAEREGFVPVRVVASAVHQLVRSIAAGRHYSAAQQPPFTPGVDGVAELSDGSLVYTGQCPAPLGMLAERTLVPARYRIPLPSGLDPATAAVVVNPGLSAYLPLTSLPTAGATVVVVGATGASGRLAIQLARELGAARVVAVGRNPEALTRSRDLGATATVALADDVAAGLRAAAPDGVDVVLDYLWVSAFTSVAGALVGNRVDPHRPVHYVNLGAVLGGTVSLDATWLRSANLHLSGSGFGSFAMELLPPAIAAVLALAAEQKLDVEFERHPLADIATTWDSSARLVYLP